jgi:hypothetical protein
MKIPKSFQLAGGVWTVVEVDTILGSALGACSRDKLRIELCKDSPKAVKEITFAHELVHAIKYTMGQTDHNETEVDAFAIILHQYLNQV